VVLRKLDSYRDGGCVDPYRSAGNTSGGGQRHETVDRPTHRHFHGGGDNSGAAQTVDMVRLGRPRGLKTRKRPIIRVTVDHLLRFIRLPSGKILQNRIY